MDITRKLATVRVIDGVFPIENADAIECAVIGGWKVVVKKGDLKTGDLALYLEIDSFLPEGNPAWQFLVDKQPREFLGVRGHRLRTIRLRGQVSQGFLIPVDVLQDVKKFVNGTANAEDFAAAQIQEGTDLLDMDFSHLLNVTKYDPPLPAQLQGNALGLFPSFIQKTDEPRIQNKVREVFGYTATQFVSPSRIKIEVAHPANNQYIMCYCDDGKEWPALWNTTTPPVPNVVEWAPINVRQPEASPDDEYEITIKMDGSSTTFFHYNEETGVCSRNLQLATSDANKDNSFVRMFFDSNINVILPKLGNLAIQGELMGPGIQGNPENLSDFKFFLFNVQVLDERRYMTPDERCDLFDKILGYGANPNKFLHVPILHKKTKLTTLGIRNVQDMIDFADGPSYVNKVREGLVFKKVDGTFSVKAISNKWLINEK